jgi:tetratricopeptide (TPR) repeat protein
MKKVLFILFLSIVSFGFTQSADELFSQANGLYKDGKYQESIDLYEKIEGLGVQSEELYFNLGNSYYKLNMVAPSIYNYERALKINPLNEDALINLEFANRMAMDAIIALPKSVFQKFSDAVIYKLPYESWAIISILLSFLGALLFLLYHFSYTSSKKLLFFNTSILSSILLILTVFFAFKAFDYEENTLMAIVFEKTAEIKNGPTLNSDTVFELHEGTKIQVLDGIDDWMKIKLADGKIGWIIAEYIKEI